MSSNHKVVFEDGSYHVYDGQTRTNQSSTSKVIAENLAKKLNENCPDHPISPPPPPPKIKF